MPSILSSSLPFLFLFLSPFFLSPDLLFLLFSSFPPPCFLSPFLHSVISSFSSTLLPLSSHLFSCFSVISSPSLFALSFSSSLRFHRLYHPLFLPSIISSPLPSQFIVFPSFLSLFLLFPFIHLPSVSPIHYFITPLSVLPFFYSSFPLACCSLSSSIYFPFRSLPFPLPFPVAYTCVSVDVRAARESSLRERPLTSHLCSSPVHMYCC